jgi:hypothetical protein
MEKLKFIKVILFATDSHKFAPNTVQLMPLDAISHLTENEPGNTHSGYRVHIKKTFALDAPFPFKSIQAPILTKEQVEVIAGNR